MFKNKVVRALSKNNILALFVLSFMFTIAIFSQVSPELQNYGVSSVSGSPYVSETSYNNLNLYAEDPATATSADRAEYQEALGRDGTSPDALPAWRWSSIELDADTGGFLGFFQQVPVSIATLFLIIAQFAWTLLLGLSKIALDPTSILGPAAPAINTVVNQIGERVVLFTILFWVIVFAKIIKNMARGRVKEALTSLVLFSLLFSGVLVILNGTSAAVNLPDQDQVYAKNTMPWFANTISGASLSVAGDLALATDSFKSNFTETQSQDQGASPNCIQYNNAIYEAYKQGSNNKALPTLSKLWEQTQYKAWTAALFGSKVGDVDLGGRVMCHWAESVNRTPATTQQKVAALAYGPAFGPTSSDVPAALQARPVVTLNPGETFAIFGPLSQDDRRRAMTVWAACQLNGNTWETAPYFKGVWANDLTQDVLGQVDPHKCSYPFSTAKDGLTRNTDLNGGGSGVGDDFLIFGDRVEDSLDGLSGTDREQLVAMESFTTALSGGNTSDRLLQSFLALLVSIFFLYALGFLSIGMIAAQLMLIILLMLFPLAIALLAIGSPKAKPMLKLTGTTAVAQAIFALILVTLLMLSSLFQELLSVLAPSGFLRSLMVGLAPIAAFYVIHKILKTIGMGNLLTPTGSMSFLASSALVATGDSRLAKHGMLDSNGKNGVQKAFSKATAKGITGAGMAGATALALTRKGKKGADYAKQTLTPEGRKKLKEKRAERKLSKKDEIKQRLATRMNKDQQGRLDKISNWADSKSLSDNVFARTLGSAARGVGLLGAGAAGLSVMGARKLYDSSSAEVRQSLDGAGNRIRKQLGSDWGDQTAKFDGNSELIPIKDKKYVDSEVATDLKKFDDLMLESAIKTDPSSANSLRIEASGQLIEGMAKATLGTNFDQIETVNDMANIKYAASLSRGVSPKDLIVSSSGLVVPRAWEFDKERIKTLSIEESKDPMYWLPMEDKLQIEGESPDQYAARIVTTCYERGLITSNGSFVDAYSLAGYNTEKESDLMEIQAWMAGKENKKLDNFVIISKNSAKEQRSIESSKKWIERNYSNRDKITIESQAQAYGDLIDAPDVIPLKLALVHDSHKNVLEKLENQKKVAEQIIVIEEKFKTREIDLASSSGGKRASIENELFELRKQHENLETQRKEGGNELDRAFSDIRDTLFDHVNTMIRTKMDVSIANGDITTESQIFEGMLTEFETFIASFENLDRNVSQAWLGSTGAISKLIEDLTNITSGLDSQSEEIINKAKEALQVAELDEAQITAVRNVRKGNKTLTAKELSETFGGSVLP